MHFTVESLEARHLLSVPGGEEQSSLEQTDVAVEGYFSPDDFGSLIDLGYHAFEGIVSLMQEYPMAVGAVAGVRNMMYGMTVSYVSGGKEGFSKLLHPVVIFAPVVGALSMGALQTAGMSFSTALIVPFGAQFAGILSHLLVKRPAGG